MTPQEQQMIEGLIARVNGANLSDKDPQADSLLRQGLGSNPNALYVLAQTVIVQGYALQQAQKQLAEAQNRPQPQQHTSFLGSLFGHTDPPAPPPPPQQQGYGQPQPSAGYAPVPGYTQAPPQGYGAPASSGGGFLRGAMQTAAGVAAGALAFQGVESLMHGFGNAAGYGNSNLGGFDGGAPREEVINNYYGDGGDRDSGRSSFGSDADNGGSLSPDIEDRRDNFNDGSGDDPSTDDTASGFDDNSGSFDDGGSSFDDGGGSFDSGGGDDSNFS